VTSGTRGSAAPGTPGGESSPGVSGARDSGGLPRLALDPGSWRSWDEEPREPEHDEAYGASLVRAAAKSGRDESVSTGEGTIEDRPVAVMSGNFGFLGGSIGQAAAARLVRCAERATERRLPLLACTASGGTRMQEGAPGFTAALGVTAAVARHRDAGLPYLVYLRNPTFGGVLATWASLGWPVLAEPGAAIGFLGPRPYAALGGTGDPRATQTAENLAAHDLIDAVVPPKDLRAVLGGLLSGLPGGGPRGTTTPGTPAKEQPDPGRSPAGSDAWESIAASRRPDRPGLRQVLGSGTVTWLAGGLTAGIAGEVTADDTDDPPGSPLAVGTARIGGHRCVVVGQDRSVPKSRPLGPAALRRAQRAIAAAGALGLPLVTLIDTAGAELTQAAEEGGVAFEIARCVDAMLRLPVPTVAVLLGQGAGGGAIALAAADRLIALEHSWLAPLAPEGASAIVHGHPNRAAELARGQRISAGELLNRGIADTVLPEPAAFTGGITAAVARALDELTGPDRPAPAGSQAGNQAGNQAANRGNTRYARFRRLAEPEPPEARR
jgi:acetyl-CoA carboxylase carboxyl transferase subunit beta